MGNVDSILRYFLGNKRLSKDLNKVKIPNKINVNDIKIMSYLCFKASRIRYFLLHLKIVEVSVARYLRTPPAAAKQQDLSFQCFELLTQLEPLELCCHLQLAILNR